MVTVKFQPLFSSLISLASLDYVCICSISAALHGLDDLFDAAMQTSYVNAVQKIVCPAVTKILCILYNILCDCNHWILRQTSLLH